jgi:hypothetical protein
LARATTTESKAIVHVVSQTKMTQRLLISACFCWVRATTIGSKPIHRRFLLY